MTSSALTHEEHLQEIADAADSLESQFIVTGKNAPAEGSVFTVKVLRTGTTVQLPVSQREINGGALAPLITEAKPSPFGMGGETVVDPSVRNASHLFEDDIEVGGIPLADILEHVRATLVPDEDAITAELHKLNIYTAGGHFKQHKDTPRDEQQFGSLVVCLPVPFKGGALSFEHGGKRQTCDWAHRTPSLPYQYHPYNDPDAAAKRKEAEDKFREGLLDQKSATRSSGLRSSVTSPTRYHKSLRVIA